MSAAADDAFDRLVSAQAGESPGRSRRRVLLERAAYRLLDPELGVLEIAVEAGYSSHEAFTRAFTKAYRQTPSQWRTRPGRLALDAPSGVHFHPPAALTLPARRRGESDGPVDQAGRAQPRPDRGAARAGCGPPGRGAGRPAARGAGHDGRLADDAPRALPRGLRAGCLAGRR